MYPPVRQLHTRPRRYRPVNAKAAPANPSRSKLALLTWAGAYAVITLLLAAVGPAIASRPLALRTLVLSAAMVAALTWVIMPRLARLFGGWLHPRA